jgi:hypothetical protein
MEQENLMTDPTLPGLTPHTQQEKARQIHDRQVLLSELRQQAAEAGDRQLATQADALEAQYHAADVAMLTKDVYRSAAHEAAPAGLGWIRASEHPEMLRERGIDWSDDDIRKLLQPDESDFRAEIYLPDPAVYGPDAKPVIVFKGSNGPVSAVDEHGNRYTRESALEDWIENGRQGIGLESDHYNRAMTLARVFQRAHRQAFEIAGHSKGGGMALAGSAVTGMPSHTFNSASLHPETAKRYAAQHGLHTFDVDALTQGYYVRGEVLHDGLALPQDMAPRQRQQLARAIGNASELSRIPEARALLDGYLKQTLPYDPGMQRDALGLVEHLAAHADGKLLAQVPPPSGADHLVALAPKSRDANGRLVDRAPQPSLADIEHDAGPLLNVVAGALGGAALGKRGGDVVASGGRVVEHGAQALGTQAQAFWNISGHVAGAQARTSGQVFGETIRYGGEAVAGMRLAGGRAEALLDRAQARTAEWSNATTGRLLRAASHLPLLGDLEHLADQRDRETASYARGQREEAVQALHDARGDAGAIRRSVAGGADAVEGASARAAAAIRAGAHGVGGAHDAALRTAGASLRSVTDRAPAAGALYGGAAGAQTAAAFTYATSLPTGLHNGAKTYRAVTGAGDAAHEAVTRHGMEDVVQPSLDARTRQMEHEALERLRTLRHSPEAPTHATPARDDGRASLLIDDPRHDAFPLYQSAERGVFAQDAQVGRQPDMRSRQLAGSLAAEVHAAGGSRVDHVLMSADASRTFGVQGGLHDPSHLRVSIDTVGAMATSLQQSTQRVAEIDAQQTRQQAQVLEQPQQARVAGPHLA